jgi:L-2-hydroxycarboxylate dehydrogenase (NAD+)
VVGLLAGDAAVKRARSTGLAMVTVCNNNHLGLLAGYVEQIARHGQIGVVLTTSEALVHPWNGAEAMIGTNPVAIGVPASPEPFILDMATGAISMGKLIAHRHRDLPLDSGWAVDAQGEPTCDPHRARAISPFGGPKGYGLALALELLVGAISGTALGRDVVGTLDTTWPCNKGDLVISIDPAAFGETEQLERVSDYLDAVRRSPARPGSGGVGIPGDGARRRRDAAMADGIEIADTVWQELRRLDEASAAA